MAFNTGWKTPGTIANVDRSGSPAWSNTANADTLDNAYASVIITDAQNVGDYLRASNFGFALPTGATILGIEVRFLVYGSGATLDDDEVLLYDAAGTIGTENRATNAIMSSKKGTAKYKTFGSSTDLWADTWTEANVEDTDFGFAFSAGNIGTSTETCFVNVMQMRVWFDEGLKSNWGRRVKITLDSAAVAVGIHSDVIFQLGTQNGVALTGSFPSEMVDADGSTPMDTAAADLRITKDIDGLIPLNHFVERVELDNDPAESDVSVWFKAPIVLSGEDYEFYLWYDNTGAVAPTAEFEQDTWDSWLWVHMYGVTVSGSTVVPDETKYALDTTMAEVGSGSSFSRVDSNSYLGGYGYDINSLNGTNFVRGTYDTAVSEQLLTNYDTNIPPTWTKVFLGTLVANNAAEGFCLGTCNIFAGETTATWIFAAGGGATADGNVTNDGDGAPASPSSSVKGNLTGFTIGNQRGENNYRANCIAPNPVAANDPLCAFGKLTAACGLSIYVNGGVIGNLDNYFHTNLDVDYFSVIIPRDLDMQIFHNAYDAVNEGGADIIADFTGTCFEPLTVGWHRTFYEEVLNQSTHITVGTPGSTAETVTVSVHVTDTSGVDIQNARVEVTATETLGSVTIGDVLLTGLTDVNGILATTTFAYEGDLDVSIKVRQTSTSPLKKNSLSSAEIVATGLTITIALISDE
jgi:hypothetical protein